MKNIVLIGMPAAGKSTVGVLLAKTLVMSFADTDLLIQQKYNKNLCDIISENGTDAFLRIENDVICSAQFTDSVIATGGSAVYGEACMKKLKENGIVIYLKLPVEEIESRIKDITTRGIAMKGSSTVAQLYEQRAKLYEKYADITINCSGLNPEQCVENIISILKNN